MRRRNRRTLTPFLFLQVHGKREKEWKGIYSVIFLLISLWPSFFFIICTLTLNLLLFVHWPLVVTQFWIHQDFLKCYFISIIIYKNPKKLRKRKIQKYIFLESTASFRQNRVHQVNTGQTMSTRVKNEFRAVSGQSRHFWPKPSSPSQYGSNHVDQGKKWVSGRFGSKPLFLTKTEFTRSIRVKPCRPG
jgi:hypothetical protein